MPTYEYECSSCDRRFELRRSMHDGDEPACPSCGASTVRRVFSVFMTSSGGPAPAATTGGSGGGCGCGGACACGH
ncbi:MAG: zinc ribbon domain-containing protein [Actinomycetota bacterium]